MDDSISSFGRAECGTLKAYVSRRYLCTGFSTLVQGSGYDIGPMEIRCAVIIL